MLDFHPTKDRFPCSHDVEVTEDIPRFLAALVAMRLLVTIHSLRQRVSLRSDSGITAVTLG